MGLFHNLIDNIGYKIGKALTEDIHVYGELTREKIGSILRKRKLKQCRISIIKRKTGSCLVEVYSNNTFLNIHCGSIADNIRETIYGNDGVPWDED